jgi:DNA-binding SARP family transcriptional activator
MRQEMEVLTDLARERLVDLYERGERCALTGLIPQAELLFAQVWDAAAKDDPDLASAAAWSIAWIMLQEKNYRRAAEWFGRVARWPESAVRTWPLAHKIVLQHCRALAQEAPPQPVAARPAPPVSRLPLLSITNLGRFQIARAGQTLPTCSARKAVALLRYLLTRKHYAAHKDELIDLLWPESEPHGAAHSLHVTVATLRRYLDPPGMSYLVFDAGYYSIVPNAPIVEDVDEFQYLVDQAEQCWRTDDMAGAQARYAGAVACYQGDYYVDERDMIWAVAERERLLVRYLTALDRLARTYLAQDQVEAAAECYQRLLERDIYREDAHYQLMRCYIQLGRRHEALRQYESFRALLSSELGLEPIRELQTLYRQIVGGEC